MVPRLSLFILLVCLVPAVFLRADPPLPVIPDGTFNITAYGALGDGSTNNTTAIQAALTAARNAGGGTVVVPAAAAPYMSGPLIVYGSTNLRVEAGATLKALPYGTYPNSNSSPSNFILINNGSTHSSITGSGTIDGNGSGWWAAYEAGTINNRPRLVYINRADTVLFSGVTLTNSPTFALAFSASNNVTVDGVTITAPEDSPNTDAIDPAGSHYLIQNCTLSVGDDNIAIKAGSVFCSDIVVRNCFFGTGHGLSIGGQTNAGLDGLTVSDCTFEGTVSGLRMKADPSQGGPVRNVSYTNIRMTNVRYPIVFYSYYAQVGNPGSTSGSNQTTPAKVATYNTTPPSALTTTTLPSWKNIRIDNLTSTGSWGYCILWGLPLSDKLLSAVTFNNVSISGTVGIELFNAANVQFTGTCSINVPAGVPKFITYNAHAIVSQPQSQSVSLGGSVSFSVGTEGRSGLSDGAPGIQWNLDGAALTDGTKADGTVVSGATTQTLSLSRVGSSFLGSYTATVTNKLDTYNAGVTSLVSRNTDVSATSAAAVLSLATPNTTRLKGLAVRTESGPGDEVLIVGIVVSGLGEGARKSVIVRGLGPALEKDGISNFIRDPFLKLYEGTTLTASNDDWDAGAVLAELTRMQLNNLASGSKDCVLLSAFPNGAYSLHLGAKTEERGVVMAEVYESDSTARFTGVAVRAKAGTGDKTLIGGFVVEGEGKRRVLIRGLGPALSDYLGASYLADPKLDLYSGGNVIKSNDNWGNDAALLTAFASIGMTPMASDSKDAALVAELPPGPYTVHLTGVNNTTGIAMFEIYEIP